MPKRLINFGIIGCGLMGREFGSAAARWCHLLDSSGRSLDFAPRIIAVCDQDPELMRWFQDNFSGIVLAARDYRELLSRPDIEAIYCAVPHNLHSQIYVDVIRAGKHLLGEKPFGIDKTANAQITAAAAASPNILVRCSSEFPFFPGALRILEALREGRFGTIIEVDAGFWHCSDLDPNKKINWKRLIEFNGAYGCMGDLGMHVVHIPFRMGWFPKNVRALLAKVIRERPDSTGRMVPCETWDNAVLACEVETNGQCFPMFLSTKRIAPGEADTWFLRVWGTRFSAEFSTKQPRTLRTLPYAPGAPQAWRCEDLGYRSAYSAITGAIFEFGFSDAILQMWAAFCDELVHGSKQMLQPFTCVTPEETRQSHILFTAAEESQRSESTVKLSAGD